MIVFRSVWIFAVILHSPKSFSTPNYTLIRRVWRSYSAVPLLLNDDGSSNDDDEYKVQLHEVHRFGEDALDEV